MKKLSKRTWLIASGLFLLPFGILISSIYLISSAIMLKKPQKNNELNYVIKKSVTHIKKGVM